MKNDRLFHILYLLMEHQVMTAKELAECLGVSSRTIYRDLDVLVKAGIPIYATRGQSGGIHLREHFAINGIWREEEHDSSGRFAKTHPIPPSFVNLEFKLSPKAAHKALGLFLPESVEDLAEGGSYVRTSFLSGWWMMSFLLSFGAELEVIQPKWVREWICKEAERIQKKYRKFL